MGTKRMTTVAMLTGIALVIFIAEMQIPPLVAIPGIKLGLANIVTLFALVSMGRKEAFAILMLRILIGSIFSGGINSLIYSICGGALCFITMISALKLTKKVPVISIFGALAHNIGQIAAACVTVGDIKVAYYLPALIISGIITGFFTGICAMYLLKNRYIMQLVK